MRQRLHRDSRLSCRSGQGRFRDGLAGIRQKLQSSFQVDWPAKAFFIERRLMNVCAESKCARNSGKKAMQRLAAGIQGDDRFTSTLSNNSGEHRTGTNFKKEVNLSGRETECFREQDRLGDLRR